MPLHIFVDLRTETLVHVFRGDEKEAKRFLEHKQEHQVTHIRVDHGKVTVNGD